jgi:hypothetical protein
MRPPMPRRVRIEHNEPGVVSTVTPVRPCVADVLAVLASGLRLTIAGVLAGLVLRDLDTWETREVELTLDGLLRAGRVDYHDATPPRGYGLVKPTPANTTNAGNGNGNGAVRPARSAR